MTRDEAFTRAHELLKSIYGKEWVEKRKNDFFEEWSQEQDGQFIIRITQSDDRDRMIIPGTFDEWYNALCSIPKNNFGEHQAVFMVDINKENVSIVSHY